MKNILLMLSGIVISCLTANAQKAPIKFGDIPMEDMKMTVYPKDSSAEAVVLADYGVSMIEYNSSSGFQVNFERTRRIKILTKEGLRFADFSIATYHEGDREEKITGLKVVTYNLENGKIVETKAKSDAFIKEEFDKNRTLYKGSWINVKEGSVIEITYKLRSDFLFNFQDWEFQSTIPVRWSEYRAQIPEYFNYQKYMQGYIGLVINESESESGSLSYQVREAPDNKYAGRGTVSTQSINYTKNTFRWAAQDVPAFKKEPYLTTSSDYISKINFELAYTNFPGEGTETYMGSWQDINAKYWRALSDDINGNGSLKDDVAKATAGATNDEQKISMIFDFVRNNVLWNEYYRTYPDQSPKKTLDSKKGSSADINILLASMIEKTGIVVNPVLLSTRDHGFIREGTPLSSQFNYLICQAKIGDKVVLLDATTRILPMGIIPERCLNGQGMVVGETGFKWIGLSPLVKSRTMYNADIAFSESGEMNTTLKIDKSGYHSARARNQYLSKGEGEYMKTFTDQKPWNISKSEFANVNDISQPFKEVHQFTINDHATMTGNNIYFNPFITGREAENPFKTEKREYPVDFGNTFEHMYLAKISIPEGYVVEELPATKVFALPENAARYTYSMAQTGSTINLVSTLSVNRQLFTQDQYPNLREFYNQVIAKMAEQVVLKKKQ